MPYQGIAGELDGQSAMEGTNRMEIIHLREQKSMDVSAMEIRAVPDGHYDMEYVYNGSDSDLVISGPTEGMYVNGISMGDSILNFFYENIAVFFCTVYAAVMAETVLKEPRERGKPS